MTGPSSSKELFDLAREISQKRLAESSKVSDYEAAAAAFRAQTELDRRGLGQALAEFERGGAIVPPVPHTLRGRLGAVVVGASIRFLWWIGRAFGMRDVVLRAMYETLLDQQIELQSLRTRIEKLESARR